MASLSPFDVWVWRKDFTKVGPLPEPLFLTVDLRHNQQSTAQFAIEGNTARLAEILAPGRITIAYRLGGVSTQILSGPVTGWQRTGPKSSPIYTITVTDDWWLFSRMLTWPTPASALGSQTVAYDAQTGPAETVLKHYVTANKGHLTDPISVAADSARGGTITVSERFKPLTDDVIPQLDSAGLGSSVRQVGSGLVVDVYPTRIYPRPLTEDSGVVSDVTLSWNAPTSTRVVVGGPGDGTARLFTLVSNPALEAQIGYSIESFLDATQTDANTTTGATQRTALGTALLAANRVTSGVSVALAQTSIFQYDPTGARGVKVGDVIPIEVADGQVVNDVLRSCALSWSSDQGFDVTPQVGDITGDPDRRLAAQLAAIARANRNRSTH